MDLIWPSEEHAADLSTCQVSRMMFCPYPYRPGLGDVGSVSAALAACIFAVDDTDSVLTRGRALYRSGPVVLAGDQRQSGTAVPLKDMFKAFNQGTSEEATTKVDDSLRWAASAKPVRAPRRRDPGNNPAGRSGPLATFCVPGLPPSQLTTGICSRSADYAFVKPERRDFGLATRSTSSERRRLPIRRSP